MSESESKRKEEKLVKEHLYIYSIHIYEERVSESVLLFLSMYTHTL